MSQLSKEEIKAALEAAQKLGMRCVRLKQGDMSFNAVRSSSPVESFEEEYFEAETEATGPQESPVPAPVVGYIRGLSKLEIGQKVEAGAVVAEITALGLANDVVCKTSGEISEICASDGDAVEYGQTILKVKAGE